MEKPFRYDVFLSFRGEDTRNNFTSHLYGALKKHVLEVFHDTSLPKGLNIGPQLMRAIEESRIYVVVFSTNFADSKWCLDELSNMTDCVQRNAKQILLPIYLDMVRYDIITQQAFIDHEKIFDEKKIQKWKEALREAGKLPGLHLQNDASRDEFLHQIVEKIRNLLHEPNLHTTDLHPLVGIKSRVQDVISLLNESCDENDDVRIVTICGPMGIGKTTIAKATYDCISIGFEAQYGIFLEDVKTLFAQPDGKVILQKRFISNLVQDDDTRIFIHDCHQGIKMIEKMINHKQVFLVLDDVDNDEQLKILGVSRALLGRGSRIIITTRDESVVRWVRPDDIYKPVLLDESESMKVLCWNAFRKDHPMEGYDELLKEAVSWCKGRPGVLKDLGEHLRCYESHLWQCALKHFMHNGEKE